MELVHRESLSLRPFGAGVQPLRLQPIQIPATMRREDVNQVTARRPEGNLERIGFGINGDPFLLASWPVTMKRGDPGSKRVLPRLQNEANPPAVRREFRRIEMAAGFESGGKRNHGADLFGFKIHDIHVIVRIRIGPKQNRPCVW